MILRSSSAPVLSALLSEGDNDFSAFNKPFAASNHWNPLLLNRGLSSKHTPPMRRPHSETDLQGVVYEAVDHVHTREKKKHHHNFSKLPTVEQKDLRLNSELDERCLEKEDLMRPCSGEGGSQQSAHSSVSTSSHVSAPRVRGNPPVNEVDRLNPLLMASGIGMSSKADQALIMNVGGDFYGCDGGRGSSGGCGGPSSSPHGDSNTTDLYYQKLLQSDPQNPLVLRNYAQFLSEAKHDFNKSEEYYERAILACPNDGEVLSKYAKHVWDVHKDSERAGSYFDQAVRATPDDCYVLASYAAFLWQSEEDEEDSNKSTKTVFGVLDETCGVRLPLVASG